jgi:23S rRNA (uracil1939-C5)-methyltransferase
MLKESDRCTARITGYTSDGEGVCRVDGEAVFVPGALAGEECRLRIVNVGKTCAHAKLEQVLEPSPHRIEPDCPYFPACGGCDFRQMDYEEELSLKKQRVLDALTRIGGLAVRELPITGAPALDGYRNKAQYPAANQKGRAVCGFYRARTHEVIAVERCRLQPPEADRIRAAVLSWMSENHVSVYDERAHKGCVRHVFVRFGAATGQILVCVVGFCRSVPAPKELVAAVLAAVPETTSIVFCFNDKHGNTVLGDRFETLCGPGWIEDTLLGLRFRLSPRSFYQINHAQAERLYEKALEFAALTKDDTALDLYCGTGTITLLLAARAGTAVGVEIIPEAIADARENAQRNGVPNAEFFCADAGEAARRFAENGTRPDVIVVDPPRKGVSADVIEAMRAMAPRRIVYVSCDPATLARDVKLLSEDYRFERAEAFDLFPRCAHVETVVLMSRVEGK